MVVFDGVCYSLSPSLSPTRRNELASVLDLNGAAPHPPYTHLIAPSASHAHNNATADPAVHVVTDRWVDRSVIMGKRQPEQYYSPDPTMIFSGVVACATDLSAADLEVLSAGITALGGQWRAGLTRDVTHLFALRTGSDKYNTALHFAPQTHMCILTPHWFDDAVRLGRHIPETPYTWPDPPILRPGVTLSIEDDQAATDGRRRRKPAADTDAGALSQGENVRVWADRRILLSTSLELADGSRRAIEARIQRAGGVIVPISLDADEDVEEKAIDEADVLITRWRSGKSYFKAARGSLLIGTLSWLFNVESSGTLHSPLDSLLWYPTPKGGIPGLVGCEISITNYTGAARDYLKRLILLVGAKFTPSMSQSNKVLIAGFQPSPKTTRALSWSIPVVNHTWLEDCFVEWRSLTVGLERYIMYPPGVDFGKILMTRHDEPPSSQPVPAQRLSGGAVPGGRGVGTIDLELDETRDTEHRTRTREDGGAPGPSTAEGVSMALSDADVRPRSRAGSVKKTPSSARVRRGSMSTPATGAFVDHVIALPEDDDADVNDARQTPLMGKPRARGTGKETEAVVRHSGGSAKDKGGKGKEGAPRTRPAEEDEEDEEDVPRPPKAKSRLVPRKADDGMDDEAAGETGEPRRGKVAEAMAMASDLESRVGAGESERESVPPRRPTGTGSRTPVKSGMKPRQRSKSQSRPSSVFDGESEVESRVVAKRPRKSSGSEKRRGEVAKPIRRDGKGKETEKTNRGRKETKKVAPPRPRSSTRSSSPPSPDTRTPKRRLSVVVPSVPKEYFSSQGALETDGEGDTGKKRDADAGPTRRQRASTGSMQAVAAEAVTSTRKRGRPSPANISISAPPGKLKPQSRAQAKAKPGAPSKPAKAHADEDKDTGDEEDAGNTSMVVEIPVASTSRGGLRRSAANKATTRLREEVMPDVVSFEKEQKHAKRRRSMGGESVASVRDEDEREARGGKKRKVAARVEEEEEEAEVEDVVLVSSVKPKPRLSDVKGKGKGTISIDSDDDTDNPSAKNRPNGAQEKKGGRGRPKESVAVRLMTTGVALSDDIVKRLTKLGAQMTTKPMDCTHLVAKGIVRTEKFLCAMSVSPYILTEAWANASAKSGKLLPEKDYFLSDAAAEQKWAFTFEDAMARAKGPDGGPNLFKDMTFYVTPKVGVDAKLLKNVIAAGGGQVQTSTPPTVRILKGKGKRYVISCEEDKAMWRSLVQEGFKVYSPELVLRAALRQEVEWENEACIVAG